RAGGWERYWLLHRRGRPTLQLEVRFTGLRPGATYHYRIRSAGADPNRPLRDDAALEQLLLADDITFRTAPSPAQGGRVRFAAMGDLGPGKSKPSYFYDVCDLFTRVARDRGAQLWLPLGDLDNDTDGHPNGLDPFFFNVYNAYRDARSPHNTSAVGGLAQPTSVRAFGNPRYHGLLGGLPAFPTFGNHDICLHNDGRMRLFRKAYFGSFVLPSARDGWCDAARDFNAEGAGFFYTFRWGNVIFVSLGLPQIKGCWVAPGESWKRHWGKRQERSLERYLSALGPEAIRPDVWVIVYFHDQDCGLDRRKRNTYQHLFLRHGVDLALMGHDHQFQAQDIRDATRHYRALVVGTGGFGDPDPGDHCRRPGFVLLDVSGDTLCYWKYDTHRCDDTGTPVARDALDHRIREHCRMTKTGLGAHRIEEDTTLNEKC
ncbi:MAG: metallophosphoesterase, partial [bacterium]